MIFTTIFAFINLLLLLCISGGLVYLFILLVRALQKYLKSRDIRKDTSAVRKSLGGALKEHRIRCHMAQECVAERLGVSRQAVSKWENGTSDPSTANLLSLANLYSVSLEDLLN